MKKILALVLAVLMLTLSACAVAEEAKVMTHDEYVAAELETLVTVEAYVQAKQGWWKGEGTVYAQAEDGGYFFYSLQMDEDMYNLLVPGTKIRVTGYKVEYAGEIEINGRDTDTTFEIIEAEPYIAVAEDVSALLGTDELINHQNELVSFKGMTVVAKKDAENNDVAFLYNWDGSGRPGDNSDLYFDVSINGATYTFTVESYLCGEGTEVYDAVTKLNIGDVIDLEGFLYWYNGANPHIISVKPAN